MSNPSLLCVPYRFKTSKLYSQIPDSGLGDFAVTRTTTPTAGQATRVNAAGLIELVADNVPRLDYPLGGITAGCPALLVEPSGSNLLQRSEEFENAYWAKANGAVTQNQTTAPDGLTTADKYVVTSGAVANSPIIRAFTFATNTTYTLSLFVKKADYDTASIRLNTTETGLIANFFNLASGTATNNQIQNYGNGWYRVWVSFTTAATVTNGQVQLIRDAEVRDGVAGIFIWGAQLETGSIATSYIPTAASPVTRGAETISKTGISSLIGQTEGTLYVEVDIRNFQIARVLGISDNTQDNRIAFLTNTTNIIRALVTQGGSTQADISTSTGLTNGTYKIAFAYASNDFVLYVNGTQIGTDTSGLVPACSGVYIGKLETSSTTLQINNRIRAAALYTTRLTNDQLQSLTQ